MVAKTGRILMSLLIFLSVFMVSTSMTFANSYMSICFAGAEINISATDAVPQRQVRDVANAVQLMLNYMKANFGLSFERNININIVSELERGDVMDYRDSESKVGGQSNGNEINLVLAENASPQYITFLTTHEMTHQYQMACAGGNMAMNRNMWFTEGMADYIGIELASIQDGTAKAKFKETAISNVLSNPISLMSITDKTSWKNAFYSKSKTYAKADLAIMYLNKKFSPRIMFVYLNNVAKASANTAMVQTYGMSIEELDNILSGNISSTYAKMPKQYTIEDYWGSR